MKRLGRGLGAILEDAEAGYLKDLPQSGVNEIEIEKIIPNPYQPRKEFSEESIEELANSISKSRSYVTNLLRILNLPKFVQEKIKNNILSVAAS